MTAELVPALLSREQARGMAAGSGLGGSVYIFLSYLSFPSIPIQLLTGPDRSRLRWPYSVPWYGCKWPAVVQRAWAAESGRLVDADAAMKRDRCA